MFISVFADVSLALSELLISTIPIFYGPNGGLTIEHLLGQQIIILINLHLHFLLLNSEVTFGDKGPIVTSISMFLDLRLLVA